MEASGPAEEEAAAAEQTASSLPSSLSSSPAWRGNSTYEDESGGPGSSGPASLLGQAGLADCSPGLEYDLWEGQFQFLAGEPRQQFLGKLAYSRPTQQVQMIQDQMHALVDTQSAGEERYARVKHENATLQARILMLEEAARDAEARAEEKLEAEQRRAREYTSRLEREKELQLENCAIKLQAAELESSRAKDEAVRLREQLDRLRAEKSRVEAALEDAQQDIHGLKEAERQAGFGFAELNRALKRAEEELAQKAGLERRIGEMDEEMKSLRLHNKNLEESRDELQAAAAALQAGRQLLMPAGQDPNDNTIGRRSSPNLATELRLTTTVHDQADGADTGMSPTTDICDNFTTLAEAKQALKEQREVNTRLRSYIDNILLNIVENYPQLLEVKQPH